MFSLHLGKKAKVFGAALIMSGTLAAVSSSGADAATEPSVPSFPEPTTLPICAKPGPQRPSSVPPKPVGDARASHCAVAPANAGLNLKGFDNSKFLRLDAAGQAELKEKNGVPGRVVKGSACHTECQNGIQEVSPSGNRHGVQARLMAQNPILRADHQAVYNWIGIENQQLFGELVQIGLTFNSWPSDEYCAGGNNVPGRNIIHIQWAVSDNYNDPVCFPGYIFGTGSMTWFAITDNGGGWWNFWMEWNGQWQALLGVNIPGGANGLTPGNAVADVVPAEILEAHSTEFDPLLRSMIKDDYLYLWPGGANWVIWNTNTTFGTKGPYVLTALTNWNPSYVEVHDKP